MIGVCAVMPLEINRINKSFGGLKALANVDLSIHEGEIIGLIGPNGSGKTTLVNVVTGTYPPDSGSVSLNGEPITSLKPYRIVGKGIARTFQGIRVFGSQTLIDSVVTAMHSRLRSNLIHDIANSRSKQVEEQAARTKARKILSNVGLSKLEDHTADKISLLDQHLLSVAIAFASDPTFLFLDEPTAGMTVEEKTPCLSLFRRFREEGTTIVIIEHDMSVIMNLCDRIAVLSAGSKIAEGSPSEIAHDPSVISAYLGASSLSK